MTGVRTMKPLATAIAAVLVAIAIILIVRTSRTDQPTKSAAGMGCGPATQELIPGSRLPDGCHLETFQGEVTTLGRLRGSKPMVLNFWASWCTYCVKEMPVLQKIATQYRDKVAFVGVDLLSIQAETREAAKRFARSKNVTYPLVYDEDGVLYLRFIARVLPPTTIFVRSDGTVAFRRFGEVDEAALKQMMKQYLDIG
ncbi:MAG: TlpA family protein disulfide reductase [Actinomycetota bacterium]